jgi:protein O-GlcNAc transferase
LTARLVDAVRSGRAAVNPFIFLTLDTTARDQRRCAESWAAAHQLRGTRPRPERRTRERLTVGYLSSDFQEHATAQLMAELFEVHDRARFRVLAYSYGRDDGSAMRMRLKDAFEAFVDLEHASHDEAARRIREDEVDILVDLKGYTTGARPEIVARCPAPVQISYLGYPGTLGMPAIDYVLVDAFVVPGEQRQHFSENVVYLPGCYQVNGRGRPIANRPSREECGLAEGAFVYCCFNAAHKITAQVFDVWMRLLRDVPESVLWLLEPHATAAENLRREAEGRLASASSRLIFAPTLPNAEHLARLGNADLCLDTLPYNAHTLAADALWAGCPVVTCPGETFASRVAGSLLHAVGMPEMVASSLEEYEAIARGLARDGSRHAAVRAKLEGNRLTTGLFDVVRFARNLEGVYEELWGG